MAYTQEDKDKVLEALIKCRGIVTNACLACNISRPTFYQWYREDESFKYLVDDVQEINIDFVENKLFDLIDKGDTAATLYYMKVKARKRGYIELSRQETGGIPASEGGVPIQTETTVKQHIAIFRDYSKDEPK